MMRVKIMFWGSKGGGARFALELSKGVAAIAKTHCSVSDKNELMKHYYKLPVVLEIKNAAPHNFWAAALYVYRGLFDCAKYWLQRREVDVVIFPMVYSVLIFHMIFYWVIRKKTIFIVHDFVPHRGEGNSLIEFSVKLSAFLASEVVVLSEGVKQEIASYWLTKSKKISKLSLPPFVDKQPVTKLVEDKGYISVLFFGRIVEYKGLGLFLKAAEVIGLKYQCIKFVVVGSGSLEPYNEILEKNYPFIEVDNRWVDESEIQKIIDKSDIVVLPYLEATQSGIIPIAQFLSKITVVTPVGGLAEQVSDGSGVVLESIDALALSSFLEQYLVDSSKFDGVKKKCGLKFSNEPWIDFGHELLGCV